MADTVQAIKYQTGSGTNPFSAASFSLAAPNLMDGSVGDSSTGYLFGTSTGDNSGVIAALIDLGASPTTAVNQVTAVRSGGCGGSINLYSSTDGTTWTNRYGGGGTSLIASPITSATARYWQVVLTTSAGSETFSDFRLYEASTVLVAPSVPAAPTGVTATAGNNQVTIAWTNASGATSANVKRSLTSGGTYTNLPLGIGVVGTSFIDTTAVNGTTYYYEVSNLNAVGEGTNSSYASATPAAAAAPTGTSGSYTAGVGNTLGWTNPTTYDGINIYRLGGFNTNGVAQRLDAQPFVQLPGNTTSFVDRTVGTGLSSLTNSNQHTYYIVGVVAGVETARSAAIGPLTFSG